MKAKTQLLNKAETGEAPSPGTALPGLMMAGQKGKNLMTTIQLSGYHSYRTCEAIKRLMYGKTFMKFDVYYSNYSSNCTLFVSTTREDTSEEELRDMFLSCLLSKVAALVEVAEKQFHIITREV